MSAKKTNGGAKPKRPVLDPLTGPKLALKGRVVCMDANRTVFASGIVYIENARITAVTGAGQAPPAGFGEVPVVETNATLYPGLIELHNHLSYNALPLWQVPRKYGDRDQWAGTADYRRLVTAPMQVVGKSPDLLPMLVRYIECKCLLGGVTTSQGIALFSAAGIRRFYRGLIRNVEQTDQADLPEALTKIPDVEARDAAKFLARLERATCLLLHLSEGRDDSAHAHFESLQISKGKWAITDALVGIHCAALKAADYRVMASHRASMVWSPLSNLLLYGHTAEIAAAKQAGVSISLGSDWSPSGSKNLFSELKVARLVNQAHAKAIFSDEEIVAMATCNPAQALKWDKALGSLEAGKRADLMAVTGTEGDPYAHLLEAHENDISLVMINGVARYGATALITALTGGKRTEKIRIAGREQSLFLEQLDADELVQKVTLADATSTLQDAFERLPELARKLEKRTTAVTGSSTLAAEPSEHQWLLALDEIQDTPLALRPDLPGPNGKRVAAQPVPQRAVSLLAKPASELVESSSIDGLTVADDATFRDTLGSEKNLTKEFKKALLTALVP